MCEESFCCCMSFWPCFSLLVLVCPCSAAQPQLPSRYLCCTTPHHASHAMPCHSAPHYTTPHPHLALATGEIASEMSPAPDWLPAARRVLLGRAGSRWARFLAALLRPSYWSKGQALRADPARRGLYIVNPTIRSRLSYLPCLLHDLIRPYLFSSCYGAQTSSLVLGPPKAPSSTTPYLTFSLLFFVLPSCQLSLRRRPLSSPLPSSPRPPPRILNATSVAPSFRGRVRASGLFCQRRPQFEGRAMVNSNAEAHQSSQAPA